MAVHTFLLDFTVDPSKMSGEASRKSLQESVEAVLSKFFPGLSRKQVSDFDGGFYELLTGDSGLTVTVRGYQKGILTCNIEYYKEDDEKALIPNEEVRSMHYNKEAFARTLESCLKTKLDCCRSKALPAIKRGTVLDIYLTTSDERILEYDIDKVVYETKSPFQKIQIVHSRSLGNLLVLDDLQNLSESDLIYTETLMARGAEDYMDKEVLILGGGDGALLWELLKEKPKFVTMVEIDELVMKACSVHLRSCCGDCLDKMRGEKYEIIVDDCVKVLQRFMHEGRKFDYVFGDLTDIPLSPTPQGEMWDFIRLILNAAFAVLKSTGKYMTHGNGASCPSSLKMFEEQLKNLKVPVEYSVSHNFIPSFMEDWVFYQVWQKQN